MDAKLFESKSSVFVKSNFLFKNVTFNCMIFSVFFSEITCEFTRNWFTYCFTLF